MSELPTTPRALVLETSSRAGFVALAHGDAVVRTRQLEEARRHTRDLAPAVVELLNALNWRPRDIDLLIVSQGPGSYTGLRVGLMAAKVFAYATGCALIAVETFEAIAHQTPDDALVIDVIADAQQGRIYHQRFVRSASTKVQPSSQLSIQPFAEWSKERDTNGCVTGPGQRAHTLPAGMLTTDPEVWDPQASSLLRIALERYRDGRHSDVWKVEPIYLRPSAAEEQWLSRRK